MEPESLSEPFAGSAHVLSAVVVDDAAELRAVIRARLRQSSGFQVVGEGRDGLEAVDLAAALRPDLVLLDVSMPRMDGLEALPLVLAASPDSRVVMYSGFEETSLAQAAQALGAAGYVEKSAPIDSLVSRLHDLLDHRGDAAASVDLPAAQDQQLLSEHLERFREVFDDAAIGMATMTLAGRIVRANGAFSDVVGLPRGQATGVSYVELAATSCRKDLEQALAGLADGGDLRVVRLEHILSRSDRRLLATVAPVLDGAQRPLYLFLQVQDLTEKEAVADELLQSEQRFRLLVEAVQDYAIFMLDPAGHIVSWNAGAERIKGYRADEAIGRHFRMFYPPEQQASRHPEHELDVALREGRYEEEGWRVRKDGSRFWASVVITAVRDALGRNVGYSKVTRDVTERRRLLDELESMNRRLSASAAEQSAFLGVTAHELRGPIGVITGSADLLASHLDELSQTEREDLLACVRSSAGRLRRLLADLLTVTRLEAGKVELRRQPLHLAFALGSAAAAVRQQHDGVVIEVDCPPGIAVDADADRLAQMLENLLTNAIVHGLPPVKVGALARDGQVEVRVADSGPGVPEGFRAELFRRFSTTGGREGSGLGLFIVRELARAQHGDAWYEPPATLEVSGAASLTGGGAAQAGGGGPSGIPIPIPIPMSRSRSMSTFVVALPAAAAAP